MLEIQQQHTKLVLGKLKPARKNTDRQTDNNTDRQKYRQMLDTDRKKLNNHTVENRQTKIHTDDGHSEKIHLSNQIENRQTCT